MSSKSLGLDIRTITFLAVGLLAFAFAPILVRWAGDVNPIALAVWRTFFAVLFITPFYYQYELKHEKTAKEFTAVKNLFLLKTISGICLGLHFILWISSLRYTSVASASVLVTIHPILLIIGEQLFFKVRFNKWIWGGVFVSFIGSLLLGYADNLTMKGTFPDALWGDFLAFAAAAVFAVYFMISRKVRQHTTWLGYVSPIYVGSAITCIVLGVLLPGELMLPDYAIWVAVGMAIGPQILGHGAMNYAVKFVSPTILSTTILVEPTLATLFGVYFFHEYPSVFALLAMLVIVSGVGLTWFGNQKMTKTSA
ncbi:DMT family transporter [bacterium]|nr:MAG: DMT family transporter [bacterium]